MAGVGLEFISRVAGYVLEKGDFRASSPNLPQRIALLGEANSANQGGLDVSKGVQITTLKQGGDLYGFGSPLYQALRILLPATGGGVGGIPVIVYPQAEAGGATARVLEITPTGVAEANAVHKLIISGRGSVDGSSYNISIASGDTTAEITQKIEDAINNALQAPVSAASDDYKATATTKWNGLTAQDVSITVDVNDNAVGITYAVVETAAGTATPSVAASLLLFGNEWNTIVINTYGAVDSVMDDLEAFNGIPDPTNPTGRYVGIIFKPFIALTGSVSDDPSAITDARKLDVTIAICPAPLSAGMPLEAAANMAVLFARINQDTPQLDVGGSFYADMPTPDAIGSMTDYITRDAIVKKGCSTVDLVAGRYQVQDFVTTYHPDGEVPPQFRYCRNLDLDFNIKFGYKLLEEINVQDKVIINDEDQVTAESFIRPKMWKAIVDEYANDLTNRALIADPAFMQDSIVVALSATNPNRLQTSFSYKRTGVVRIASTEAKAGFNFGSL